MGSAQVPRLESRGKGSRGPMRQAPWSKGPFAPCRIRQGRYARRSDTRPPRPAPESAARGGRGALRPISTRRAPQAAKSGPTRTLGSSSRPQISNELNSPARTCPACLGDVTVAWGFPLVSDRAAPHSARFRRRVCYHSTAARLQRLFLDSSSLSATTKNALACPSPHAEQGACVRACACACASVGACDRLLVRVRL
jgi:hypothetical protein